MRALLTILFCLYKFVATAQIYSGVYTRDVYSDSRKEIYFCKLKVSNYSSVALVFSDNENNTYNEYKGRIKKIDDTLAIIDVVSGFLVERFRGDYDDTLTITDGDDFVHMNKISLYYKDGACISYDLNNIEMEKFNSGSYHYRKLRLDDKHFHHKEKMDMHDGIMIRTYTSVVKLDIGHVNPISKKKVLFGVADEGIGFSNGDIKATFSLIVKDNKIKISADTLANIGPFILTKSN